MSFIALVCTPLNISNISLQITTSLFTLLGTRTTLAWCRRTFSGWRVVSAGRTGTIATLPFCAAPRATGTASLMHTSSKIPHSVFLSIQVFIWVILFLSCEYPFTSKESDRSYDGTEEFHFGGSLEKFILHVVSGRLQHNFCDFSQLPLPRNDHMMTSNPLLWGITNLYCCTKKCIGVRPFWQCNSGKLFWHVSQWPPSWHHDIPEWHKDNFIHFTMVFSQFDDHCMF